MCTSHELCIYIWVTNHVYESRTCSPELCVWVTNIYIYRDLCKWVTNYAYIFELYMSHDGVFLISAYESRTLYVSQDRVVTNNVYEPRTLHMCHTKLCIWVTNYAYESQSMQSQKMYESRTMSPKTIHRDVTNICHSHVLCEPLAVCPEL